MFCETVGDSVKVFAHLETSVNEQLSPVELLIEDKYRKELEDFDKAIQLNTKLEKHHDMLNDLLDDDN